MTTSEEDMAQMVVIARTAQARPEAGNRFNAFRAMLKEAGFKVSSEGASRAYSAAAEQQEAGSSQVSPQKPSAAVGTVIGATLADAISTLQLRDDERLRDGEAEELGNGLSFEELKTSFLTPIDEGETVEEFEERLAQGLLSVGGALESRPAERY